MPGKQAAHSSAIETEPIETCTHHSPLISHSDSTESVVKLSEKRVDAAIEDGEEGEMESDGRVGMRVREGEPAMMRRGGEKRKVGFR